MNYPEFGIFWPQKPSTSTNNNQKNQKLQPNVLASLKEGIIACIREEQDSGVRMKVCDCAGRLGILLATDMGTGSVGCLIAAVRIHPIIHNKICSSRCKLLRTNKYNNMNSSNIIRHLITGRGSVFPKIHTRGEAHLKRPQPPGLKQNM